MIRDGVDPGGERSGIGIPTRRDVREPHLPRDVDEQVTRLRIHGAFELVGCDGARRSHEHPRDGGLLASVRAGEYAPDSSDACAPAAGSLSAPKWIQRPSTTSPANWRSWPLKRDELVQRVPSHKRCLPRPSSYQPASMPSPTAGFTASARRVTPLIGEVGVVLGPARSVPPALRARAVVVPACRCCG